MQNRRNFLKISALGALAAGTGCQATTEEGTKSNTSSSSVARQPLVISTWDHGMQSNEVSWEVLAKGGTALDAVEQGVRVVESDPSGTSVGIGGAPDRNGRVTLDACIMDHRQRCGAVACMEHIENPISVARRVMEATPHVMLVGEGAYQFAIEQGFPHTNLLTEASEKRWKAWLEKAEYATEVNRENHDTIGALALDAAGDLSGACTTSGMAYKMPGRVGDSPIIGAGLFVDNEVGAACGTGVGEAIIRTAGSSIIVEMMRMGKTPQQACEEAIRRIIRFHPDHANLQVAYIALNKQGEIGACAVHPGFSYALRDGQQNILVKAPHLVKK